MNVENESYSASIEEIQSILEQGNANILKGLGITAVGVASAFAFAYTVEDMPNEIQPFTGAAAVTLTMIGLYVIDFGERFKNFAISEAKELGLSTQNNPLRGKITS